MVPSLSPNSAAQTTAIGVAGIAATGILLLVTVEDQLNLIWRVTSPRPWVQRILAYWTLITLGPLLIGISLSLSTYFEIAARQVGFGQRRPHWFASSWLHGLARLVPRCSNSSRYLALLPHSELRSALAGRRVRRRIATIAIEILKVGFSIYIGASSFYQTVYGALAIDPDLSVVDVYFLDGGAAWRGGCRCIAELADRRAGRPDPLRRRAARLQPVVDRGAGARAAAWRALSTGALAAELGVATTVVDEHLRPLAEAGLCRAYARGALGAVLDPGDRDTARSVRRSGCRSPAAGWAAASRGNGRSPAMDRIVKAEVQ